MATYSAVCDEIRERALRDEQLGDTLISSGVGSAVTAHRTESGYVSVAKYGVNLLPGGGETEYDYEMVKMYLMFTKDELKAMLGVANRKH